MCSLPAGLKRAFRPCVRTPDVLAILPNLSFLRPRTALFLWHKLGVEHGGNTGRAKKHPQRIVDHAQPDAARRKRGAKQHESVQYKAVDDRRDKGEEI